MAEQNNSEQIKSKERVADHGEVFTADREVEAMLDLVKNETERIDSRFLEPACGEGAFLIKVLQRKMAVVKTMYGKNLADYEKYAVLAISSIYGIDILEDNAQICRDRLFDEWNKQYTKMMKDEAKTAVSEAVEYILSKNIICGNALSLMCVDNEQNDTEEPITFAEWNYVLGTKIKRRDFRLDILLKAEENTSKQFTKENDMFSLFSMDEKKDDPMSIDHWDIDPITKEMVPKPIREYAPCNYWEVQNNG